MDEKKYSSERGQSLVLLAVISVVLIGILAISIDMGYTYSIRRAAQNAVDAAALAGARELCVGTDAQQATQQAVSSATDYATTRNRIFGTPNPSVNVSANVTTGEVKVDMNQGYTSFVAGFFGKRNQSVAAHATAVCSAPLSAYGAAPLSFDCNPDANGQCTNLEYSDESSGSGCDINNPKDKVYVFVDTDREVYCKDQDPNHPNGSDSHHLGVTCNYGGGAKIIPVSHHSSSSGHTGKEWAWADLPQYAKDVPGKTIPTMDKLIDGTHDNNDTHKVKCNAGTWVAQKLWTLQTGGGSYSSDIACTSTSGTEANNTWNNLCTSTIRDKTILLPTYDQHTTTPTSSEPKYGSGGEYLHVNSFAKFTLRCAHKNDSMQSCQNVTTPARQVLHLKDLENQNNETYSSVEGCFTKGTHPGLSGKTGGLPPAGTWTIYLVH